MNFCRDELQTLLDSLKQKFPLSIITTVKLMFANSSSVNINFETGEAVITIDSSSCDLSKSLLIHEYMHIYLFELSKNSFFAKILMSERAGRFVEELFLETVRAEDIFVYIQDIILLLFLRKLGDKDIIESQKLLFKQALETYLDYLRKGSITLSQLGLDLINAIFFVVLSYIYEDWISSEERTLILNFWRKYSRDPSLDMSQKTLISAVLSSIREVTRELSYYVEQQGEDIWFEILDFLVDTTINFIAKKLGKSQEIAFYVEKITVRGQKITRVIITVTD